LKLLFVIQDAHGWAGTERVTGLIAQGLSEKFDIDILSLSERSESSGGYFSSPNIAVHYQPAAKGLFGLIASNISSSKFIKKNKYNCVVISGVGEIKHFILARLQLRQKIVAWEHFNASYTHKRFNRKFAARFCRAIVVLTQADANDWHRFLRPKAEIVRISNPLASKPLQSASLKVKKILALGRLEEQKRFDLLLDAFMLIAQEFPDWNLRIRGNGSKEEALRQKIQDLGLRHRVEILPVTPDVETEYLNASIYAMSSKFEGLPMTLIEAMSYGLPCVSFDCPNGPSEIIADGKNGFIVPYGDTKALAKRLSSIMADEALKTTLGAQARASVEKFAIHPILVEWEKLITSLCTP
jgi:glycosyltransferase involved in cell wall biosynthesis